MNLAELEKIIAYQFRDRKLLEEALTHRSYLNERPDWRAPHNERLEFLGDAALELAVTEALYHRYPESEEGRLTALRAALVNYQMLAVIGKALGVEPFILLSRGEAKDTGRAREVILANVMEAIIGAIYLDGGYDATKTFVERVVLVRLDDVFRNRLDKDAKSLLQEKAQADDKVTPTYRVLEDHGPDHQKTFVVGVYFGEKLMGTGNGLSKQDAELEAARDALQKIE